jgi:hypothetical protein
MGASYDVPMGPPPSHLLSLNERFPVLVAAQTRPSNRSLLPQPDTIAMHLAALRPQQEQVCCGQRIVLF